MAKKQTQRSRAARRAPSPGADEVEGDAQRDQTGKTIVQEKIAELSVRGELADPDKPSAGISKKKGLSSKQRKRKLDAIARAESLKDVLEVKVEDSLSRLKKIQARRKRD